MSTRRARIKAVAALPQRRKNVGNVVNNTKQEETKELAENLLKSPKAGRTAADKHSGNSPARVSLSPRLLSPRKSPRAPLTPDIEKVTSGWKVPTPTQLPSERRSTTTVREKTDSNKPTTSQTDVFVSPQARASPLKKCSPVVKTPSFEIEITTDRVSNKRLHEVADKQTKVSENRENILSPIADKVAGNRSGGIKTISDGYNSPNTHENVMDGIVPLKPVNNAPKPIELLKSEIISENAEVLFDPIVPLPSPTKVRPKLRPVPRLGPMRRNSIPGSASESEDESRRAFHGGSSTPVPARQRHDSHTTTPHPNRDVNRVRNDSMCSSQVAPQTPAPGSPVKEKVTKSRRIDVSRRMTAMRRRKESLQRDKLTMFDLIFYNPLGNPIVPDQDEIKAKEATKKEEEQRKLGNSKKEEVNEESNDSNADSSAPVPQIKLGPNGEIILDEQSLVIKQSDQRKLSESVVHEGAWMSSSGKVYRRTPRTADWSDDETVRFYRALAALGTDFSLMVALFPGRSRKDIKLKFKKEERNNLAQIDKALRSVSELNADCLEIEFANERKRAKENANKHNERLQDEKKAYKEQIRAMKSMKVRQSKASLALGMSVVPDPLAHKTECVTADDILQAGMKIVNKPKPKIKQKKTTVEPMIVHNPPAPPVPTPPTPNQNFATLTLTHLLQKPRAPIVPSMSSIEMATIHKTPSLAPPPKSPVVLNALPSVPADIAPGSLVVLTVDDPKAPSQKAIHTYIKQADGSIASVILDPSVMSSLVSFVKKDTPKAGSTSSMSPSSIVSDRTNTPPALGATPKKRQRLTSYNITDL